MNNTFTFDVDAAKPLDFTLKVNNEVIVSKAISSKETIVYEFDNDVLQELAIEFCLDNKPEEYTVIDDSGNIKSDVLLNTSNIQYGDVDISQWVYDNATYHTATNVFTNIPNRFFGSLGSTGTVKFTLTTPSLLWSLENMI